MMMTSLETLKTSFALYTKLFGESVSMDIGTEGVDQSQLLTVSIEKVGGRQGILPEA
jgi:hypothetical protein